MQMSPNRKIAAVVLTTFALSVGTVGVASASQTTSKGKSVSVRQTTTRTTVNAIANPMVGALGKKGDPSTAIASVLATLVKDSTITQAQADKITAALTAARAAHEANEASKRGILEAERAARQSLIATTIGKSTAEIQSALASGQSLGAIAGDKRTALITALVADHTKKIDAAVTAGKITAAQATNMKANLTAHVTAQVDAVRPAIGPGMGKGGHKGGHGHNH
jgi:ribosomal protein S20